MSQFFKNYNKRAYLVIGASESPQKFGNKVLRWYISHKLQVIPINPTSLNICQIETYPSASAFVDHLKSDSTLSQKFSDGVCLSVITPPSVSLQVMKSLANSKSLIKSVWFQPGSYDDQTIEYCIDDLGLIKDNGSLIYEGNCILVSGEEILRKASL